ncbi:MAG: ABC transporter ATP-binding protein [Candidatus Liptonbacteria bacterium]|nr:ABC transporter ATP-binding protein [Candidatus Liptonbacteria bacterium]
MTPDEKKNRFSLVAIRELIRNSRRVFLIIWKERRGLVLAVLSVTFLISAAPFLVSGSRGFLINELVQSAQGSVSSTLLLSIALFAGALVITPLFRIFEGYMGKLFSFFLDEKFEMLIIKKKGDIDVSVHEDPRHNDLFNRVQENGVWRITNFTDRQFFIVQNAAETVIAAVILLFANWWVFLVIMIAAIPELVTEVRYGRQVWSIHTGRAEIRRRYHDLRWRFDRLPSLVELKLSQNLRHFTSIIRDLFKSFQDEEKKAERKRLAWESATFLFLQGAIIFASVWFIFEVMRGKLQIGTFTFFLASVLDFRQSLSALFRNLGRQHQDNLFVTDVFKLLDLSPALEKPTSGISLDPHRTPEIVFERVHFRYPGTKEYVLKNFSLRIAPGEKLALVGSNGAGKTTLVKLLCRFYDPDKGRILINGNDIKTVDLESWYRELGVLFQDYDNYHFLVRESIAIGRSGAMSSLEKVKGAAKASEADTFIEEWEKAYEQMLGKQFTGGIEPSIGQWQKLALARTFYRDPQVLILDEPTSSIDAEAEAKIFDRLEQLPKDRTVILISHRFSTVRHANRICVIKDGRLAELGTHAALLKRGGTYARLFKLQARGYR